MVDMTNFRNNGEVVILNTADIVLHQITETHPRMTAQAYKGLVDSIASKAGQLVPAYMYRDKLVDGRHRLKALLELGIPSIKVMYFKQNFTLEEVAEMINATEIRRHQTPTQLAIKAYRLYRSGLSREDAVTKAQSSATNLKRVISIEKLGRLDVISLLENGVSINISQDSRYEKRTDSLLAIINKIKADKASIEEVDSFTDFDAQGKPQYTKQEQAQLDAIEALMSTWSDAIKKSVVAKIYKSMEQ